MNNNLFIKDFNGLSDLAKTKKGVLWLIIQKIVVRII